MLESFENLRSWVTLRAVPAWLQSSFLEGSVLLASYASYASWSSAQCAKRESVWNRETVCEATTRRSTGLTADRDRSFGHLAASLALTICMELTFLRSVPEAGQIIDLFRLSTSLEAGLHSARLLEPVTCAKSAGAAASHRPITKEPASRKVCL